MFEVINKVYKVIKEVLKRKDTVLFRRNKSKRNRNGKTTNNIAPIMGPKLYPDPLMSSTNS
jgi:hypothetical protein